MLGAGADTTIVATSREPLDVAGEQLYVLPTLSLPDVSESTEAIGCAEAVQLCVDRAQRQRHGFALTDANVATVAQICTRLGGIPLALELVAARVRSLTIEEINGRLSACALLRLAGRLARVGQMEQAERLMAEAFPLMENAGWPKLLADYFSTHGFVKWMEGDLAPARTSYQRAVEQY